MSKSYRAGNGKFVRKDNPVAVIGRLQGKREAERQARIAELSAMRRARARKNGYHGPLTRADLMTGA